MNFFTTFPTKMVALTFAVAILLAGCKNPASNDDDHEEHSDPQGIQFVMNGEIIVTYHNGDTAGHFDVEEEQETSLITAEFLDEDGDEIHGEDLDEDYSLEWEIADSEIAEIEQHDEDGRWSFHIVGKTAGEAAVQFKLMHGDHADFSTPDINENNAIEIHVEDSNQ